MTMRETRDLAAAELRFAEGEDGVFEGYASIYGEPDSFGDTIRPGAFAKTLKNRKATPVAMLWSHDPSRPIGVWTDLSEDARGLKVKGRLIRETSGGADAYALLKAGAVNGLSIGFRARSHARAPNGGRILTDIDLVEVSLVALPAASKARVTHVKAASESAVAAFISAARRVASAIKEGRQNA